MTYTIASVGNETCDSTSTTDMSDMLEGSEIIVYEPEPIPWPDECDYKLENIPMPTPPRAPLLLRARPRPAAARAPIRLDGRGWH